MGSAIQRRKTIIKPGWHITSKFDLVYLRRQRTGHKKSNTNVELPLVSLIDMFSILVIYLLMNFSATGEIFFLQKELTLPLALKANPLESAPLISITERDVTLETEIVGSNPVVVTQDDEQMPRLAAALRQLKRVEEATKPNEKFSGRINIQADESTPLIYIKRVMRTCIMEGWTGINFAVRKE